jgi:ADP-ribosyl-[dinitrogen reductase] hydrolase
MIRHPNPLVLLRIAQADAFAAALEYVGHAEHPELHARALQFDRYLQHPSHSGLAPGRYTDDTQMSIAVSEVLLDSRTRTGSEFADAFFRCFARDRRCGYSRALQALLERSSSADELRAAIVPNSTKNGAAMRSVPLGVLGDPQAILEVARTQAMVTHDSPGGIHSSAAVGLMSHFALHDGRGFAEMHGFCVDLLPGFAPFARPWQGPVVASNDPCGLGLGMCTAWAVHTLLVEEDSLMAMMRRLLAWGGDTDSVAAIAWGIGSTRHIVEALPEFFERDLEVGGAYGVEFLRGLGQRLMTAAL